MDIPHNPSRGNITIFLSINFNPNFYITTQIIFYKTRPFVDY